MPRPNLRRRVRLLWKGKNPQLGAKVVVWIPKTYRGKLGTVVATHSKTKGKAKLAPVDKYRVGIKLGNKAATCVCSAEEMLPRGCSIKDVIG